MALDVIDGRVAVPPGVLAVIDGGLGVPVPESIGSTQQGIGLEGYRVLVCVSECPREGFPEPRPKPNTWPD